jgi:hypothetical protein
MSDENAPSAERRAMTSDAIVVERTFDVEGTPEHAWERLEQLTADHDPGPRTWWLPGFRCRATEVAASAGHRLEVVKADQPCMGTTIVFMFEHVGTGTRIHVTQAGFDPAFVEIAGEDFWAHGAMLLDDVERFFLGGAASPTGRTAIRDRVDQGSNESSRRRQRR